MPFSTTEQESIDAEFAMLCRKYELHGTMVFARADRDAEAVPELTISVSGAHTMPSERDLRWAVLANGLSKQGHRLSTRLFQEHARLRQQHHEQHRKPNLPPK